MRAGTIHASDATRVAAGRTFDPGAGRHVDVEVGEAEGAEPGGELLSDIMRCLGAGGAVAEHDVQCEPVAVLEDLELADVGVRGESGELGWRPIATTLLTLLRSGDTLVAARQVYGDSDDLNGFDLDASDPLRDPRRRHRRPRALSMRTYADAPRCRTRTQ